MGQYYRIALKTKRNKSFHYLDRTVDNEYTLAKLMEHSWIGNRMVEAVCKKIYNNPTQIAWIGDYADDQSLEQVNQSNPLMFTYKEVVKNTWHIDDDDNQPKYFKNRGLISDANFKLSEMSLVNHDKKLVLFGASYFTTIYNQQDSVFWEKYEVSKTQKDKDELLKAFRWEVGFVPHPLPLLTAVGNGLGGGDYHGINEEKVGSWAFDLLEVVDHEKALNLLTKNHYKIYNIIFSEMIKK